MMLVLAGSSLPFMENQVLGYQSPLYGRRTGQIKLLPVDFATDRLFLPKLSKIDQAIACGVTGGIPKYLSLFTDAEALIEKSGMFRQFKEKVYYLFSKSGFTDGARSLAAVNGNIRLIDFADMFE